MRCKQKGQIHSFPRISIWLQARLPDLPSRKQDQSRNAPVRVQDRTAWGFTRYWLVQNLREVFALLERRIERGDRHYR